MSFDDFRTHCLSKPATTESLPFDETTLVFKVAGKMFAMTDIDTRPLNINLKCDPERSVQLRDEHASITGAFHMNKRHWNKVVADGSLRDSMVRELIDHSYELVVAGLPKAVRQTLV